MKNQRLSKPLRQQGLSLVELMVAITIGMLLTGVLISLLVNMSSTSREQFKAAQQIENGRYAIDLLTNDIRLAGYYGEFTKLPSISGYAALPDPCTVIAHGTTLTETTVSPLGFYVQGYVAADLSTAAAVPTNCQTFIDNASIKPGSDIIVVKRFDTQPLIDPPDTTSATSVAGQVYALTDYITLLIQHGDGSALDETMDAVGSPSTVVRKNFNPSGGAAVAAYIRKLHVHIYYVSPCSRGSGTNGKCAAGDDTIPTLKRIELTTSGGAAAMTVVPLVEGVEFLKASYGIDTDLDGSVDGAYVTAPATMADWQNIVAVDLRLLARNTEASAGYSDPKAYAMSDTLTYTPTGANLQFKRHLFNQKIYLPNVGGRRES